MGVFQPGSGFVPGGELPALKTGSKNLQCKVAIIRKSTHNPSWCWGPPSNSTPASCRVREESLMFGPVVSRCAALALHAVQPGNPSAFLPCGYPSPAHHPPARLACLLLPWSLPD